MEGGQAERRRKNKNRKKRRKKKKEKRTRKRKRKNELLAHTLFLFSLANAYKQLEKAMFPPPSYIRLPFQSHFKSESESSPNPSIRLRHQFFVNLFEFIRLTYLFRILSLAKWSPLEISHPSWPWGSCLQSRPWQPQHRLRRRTMAHSVRESFRNSNYFSIELI